MNDPIAIRKAVAESLSEMLRLPAHSIHDFQDLVGDLGVDSANAADLLVSVEERLNAILPAGAEGLIARARTVGELVDALAVALTPTGPGVDQG